MPLTLRPTDVWPRERSGSGETVRFTAGWSDTVALLEREVDALRTYTQRRDLIVVQIGVPSSGFKLDGGLRSRATPTDPGVIVSFSSVHGPMRYLCDTYRQKGWGDKYLPCWQANVRAVALGLEALRAVDRYGIAGDVQQYLGFAELPPGRPMGQSTALAAMTVEEAARFIATHGAPGLIEFGGWLNLASAVYSNELDRAFRAAARRLHPDSGGTDAEFTMLAAARDLIRSTYR